MNFDYQTLILKNIAKCKITTNFHTVTIKIGPCEDVKQPELNKDKIFLRYLLTRNIHTSTER